MDLKSLVRAVRYSDMQQRAMADPTAKRPPTIKFLGLAVALGLVAASIGIMFVSQSSQDASDVGGPLEVTPEGGPATPPGNETQPSPTPTGIPRVVARG